MATSSVLVPQEFEIVQRSVYVTPAVPVNVVPGSVLSAKLPPVPFTTVHRPAPDAGAFAVSVVLVAQTV